jgi:hypothetical protein
MLPSATKVLDILQNDYARVNSGVLENAQARGTVVHAACKNKAFGLWGSVSLEWRGYVKSFSDWFDEYVVEVLLVEELLEDKILGFCGHPDLIVRIMGDKWPSLWDLKTPVTALKKWRLQIASYKHLAIHNGFPIRRTGSIRLDPNGGKPKLLEYTGSHIEDLGVFLSLLNIQRFFEGGK